MFFGGFTVGCSDGLRPHGTEYADAARSVWSDPMMVRAVGGADGGTVMVLGRCGASEAELGTVAGGQLPEDVTWRWPGTYTVVEHRAEGVVLHTDPAGAVPLYTAEFGGGWAWSSSARALAALTGAALSAERLAVSVFASYVPAAGARSFFTGVRLLAPGSRVWLPSDGGTPRCTTVWRPDPVPGDPARRFRVVLQAAVEYRTVLDPEVSCDLSGGLDSSTLALLAAAARPAEGHLNGVTVHPDDDTSGADLHYARLAAARDPRIAHHLLSLGTEQLPYTDITAVPATDEPAPSTLARARLEYQLDWMKSEFGTRTHMTGDGGDSVLFVPPVHLADLLRHRRWARAVSEATGWARLRHTAVLPLLNDARRLAGVSRADAFADLAHTVEDAGHPAGEDRGDVTWVPQLPMPPWITEKARSLLAGELRRAAAEADALPGLDLGPRVLVDEIRELARTAAADAQLADQQGVELHNPFLDAHVVDAVLRTELRSRPPLYAYKPVLRRAMCRVLPPQLAARTTKGSFNTAHYTGMRANLPALTDLTEGHLAGLGIIEPGLLRTHLAQGAAGVPMPLAAIEQFLTTEAWLHALHRAPALVWTREENAHV
ncbi:albusnodin/ikarugamycin family macrolactam cyclase [Streptomyces xiamenensis]|uniref:albusnodin/ikarugamycin family macrolactam cyclase n=1 Tax=Streptomyces xiamenensis TaxID=408015 RepID=UPI0037D23218